MRIVWRSSANVNPIGLEARLLDMDGERVLEATFVNSMRFKQKLKAIWYILIGKSFSVSEIYLDDKED